MTQHDPNAVDGLLAAEIVPVLPPIPPDPHTGSSAPLGAHPVDWRRIDDDEATVEWRLLRGWVEWFTVRYGIPVSVVPDCWWRHGWLVEELSALHTTHLACFDPADTGYGPIGFHERLNLAMPRLQRAGAGCASGHHSIRDRTWSGSTDEDAWGAWITTGRAHGDT